MNFLPEDYKSPSVGSNYMKFQDGENRFRVLSQAIVGWLDWDDKKPLRFRYNQKPSKSIDPDREMKHFWAFIVWNYLESKIQILEISQASVRNAIEALCEDQDWGSPYNYDIKVMRKGTAPKVEYAVSPCPSKAVSDDIKRSFFEKPCNLEALFTGRDPWATNSFEGWTVAAFPTDEKLAPDSPAKTASANKTPVEESPIQKPLSRPIDHLTKIVVDSHLDPTHLTGFIEMASDKKAKPITSIIDAALRAPDNFKKAYVEWVSKHPGRPVMA